MNRFQPDHRTDHCCHTNGERAAHAEAAILAWRKAWSQGALTTGLVPDCDVRDLIADLCHWAHREGLNPDHETAAGLESWREESDVPKNARFWTFENDGWVKVTLKPGQTLRHFRAGRHEEGWFTRSNIWSHDGDRVTNTFSDDGTDCDGRLMRGGTVFCLLTELASVAPHKDDPQMPFIPEWRKQDEFQRDHAAEAAGY